MLRRCASRFLIIPAVVALYFAAQLPTLPPAERAQLASRFAFTQTELPTVPGPPMQSSRPVNPSLDHLAGWISAVGAAVALADIDGDGLPNDVCYVDTRTNQVIVAPAPDSGPADNPRQARYAPFALDFSGFAYDRTMAPMGCLPGNFTEGPETDLLVYFWGRTPVVFLRKPGPEQLGAAARRRRGVRARSAGQDCGAVRGPVRAPLRSR